MLIPRYELSQIITLELEDSEFDLDIAAPIINNCSRIMTLY